MSSVCLFPDPVVGGQDIAALVVDLGGEGVVAQGEPLVEEGLGLVGLEGEG